MKTLAQMLCSMSMDRNQWGLCFADQAGSNYKKKTLAQMLCSMSMDTKSMGSSFCTSGQLKLQDEDACSNALFDVNEHKISGVFVLYIRQARPAQTTKRTPLLTCFVRCQ